MVARVAGVPMPSASVRIFLTLGLWTNFATPHIAAMIDASVNGLGGLGALVLDDQPERRDRVVHFERRQARRWGPVLLVAVLGPFVVAGVRSVGCGVREGLPAESEGLPACGGEALSRDLELDLGLQELVRGVELREVPAGHELVD